MATADVVVEKIGADHIAHKHIAGVKYEDISLTTGADLPPVLFDWMRSTAAGTLPRKNGAVVTADYDDKEVSRLNFFNAVVTEIGLPPLDAASNDAARLTLKITSEYTRMVARSGASVRGEALGKGEQKRWLPSNFKLTIEGLDCTRVNKIEAITNKHAMVTDRVGELRDYETGPAELEVPNLVVTLAESHADSFYKWHEDFVTQGNSGPAHERNGQLDYLDSSLRRLFSVRLENLGIFRLTPEKVEAGTEYVRRIRAEMYCHRMDLVAGLAGAGGGSNGSTTAQPLSRVEQQAQQGVPATAQAAYAQASGPVRPAPRPGSV
jgi:phage tail-like protein